MRNDHGGGVIKARNRTVTHVVLEQNSALKNVQCRLTLSGQYGRVQKSGSGSGAYFWNT